MPQTYENFSKFWVLANFVSDDIVKKFRETGRKFIIVIQKDKRSHYILKVTNHNK